VGPAGIAGLDGVDDLPMFLQDRQSLADWHDAVVAYPG
jgi:hypothetical protein